VTWTIRSSSFLANAGLAWNGSLFLAVSLDDSNAAATSPDGITWTPRTTPDTAYHYGPVARGAEFIITSDSTASSFVSSDGVTWAAAALPSSGSWIAMAGNATIAVVAKDSSTAGAVAELLPDPPDPPPPGIWLRDDFTGSGALIGRTPDGPHSGVWVDAPNNYGSNPGTETISGGLLTVNTGPASYISATSPLAGSPADGYFEARILSNTSDAGTVSLGLRWQDNTPVNWFTGVLIECTAANPTTVSVDVRTGPSSDDVPPSTGTVNYTVANAADYIARLECEGTAVRLYLDGTLVFTGTQSEVVAGAAAFIYLSPSGTQAVSVNYVEAGSLGAPDTPAFWTSFVSTHEVR
jgi:hypothetical protein